jgi:hypothetical protein
VNKLIHLLDSEVWGTGSPNQVIHGERPDDEEHITRIQEADCRYPLLLFTDKYGGIDILDGFHRLVKIVHLLQRLYVSVIYVTYEQHQQALEPSIITGPAK